jgi:hypothetical protein
MSYFTWVRRFLIAVYFAITNRDTREVISNRFLEFRQSSLKRRCRNFFMKYLNNKLI